MRTQKEFKEMREERELLKAMSEMPPSEFAKTIVRERPEFSTKEMLREMAKDMRISVNELASEIIAAKTLAKDCDVQFRVSANSVYKVIAIDSDGNAEWDMRYAPEPETVNGKQFEIGYAVPENSERRSMVKAIALAEKATRMDYHFGRELLDTIGHDKGAVISSTPDGMVKVYSVRRAVNAEYAERLAEKVFAEFKAGQEKLAAIEKAIAAVPLSKGGTIESRIPVALKRERAKALDSLKAIRARVEKANARIEAAHSPNADNLRMEFAEEFDAYASAPGNAAIESLELPNAIVRRPFRELIRVKADRRDPSPVECAVLQREYERECAITRARAKAETEKILAEKAIAEKQELENARSATNAAYKERRAAAARIRRANKKGK